MHQPILFLMLGYPGAGKTTTSRLITKLTGATHIWADHERRTMFAEPTHSKEESDQLYANLNDVADTLLAEGKSVIFDTNFSYLKDREHLRNIAANREAKTILIWVTTPRDVAEHRAVHDSHEKDNRIWGNMTHEDFNRIANHLEQPRPEENALELEGSHDINEQTVEEALQNAGVLPA